MTASPTAVFRACSQFQPTVLMTISFQMMPQTH
jgi:hypothetical protein